jgi:hypothetical protein
MTNYPKIRSRERVRRDRQINEVHHDAYRAHEKPKEPTVCPQCGVVFNAGLWAWAEKPAGAHEHLCPACHRIRDNIPAGWVELSGKFMTSHAAQVLTLAQNEEQRAKAEHPLERIMSVDKQADRTVVSTTDLHLARRIGEAVQRAFHGKLVVKYSEDESAVRVYWHKDE